MDIGGHPTWIEERGSGNETVMLLHGGLENSDGLLGAIGPALGAKFRLVAFDRRGHGRTADDDEPFHYESMADEVIGVINHLGVDPVHLVGWSDGGIVALAVASREPELISKMVVIGANFHVDGFMGLELDPSSPFAAMLARDHAQRSPDGADHFGVVVQKSSALWATEPTMTVDELREISTPTLVLVGDDEPIPLDHTCTMYEALPNSQLAIVPGTSHALPLEQPGETARLIMEFLAASGTPATMLPVRRAPAKPD